MPSWRIKTITLLASRIGTSLRLGDCWVLLCASLRRWPKPTAHHSTCRKLNPKSSPVTSEYSGFKFALFFLGEYLGMFAISGLGITLFLGGWTAPFSFLTWIPSWIWFFTKLLAIIFVFIWIRGTLPRLRMDQLMNFAWKFMLPLALINILVAGIWHFMGHGLLRWLACLAVIAIAYVTLGRGLMQNQKLGKRTYRFAD